jgi:hypothetical protein
MLEMIPPLHFTKEFFINNNSTANLHCGLTVKRAFSFFFMVLTALGMAGQKCPGRKIAFLHENLTYEG